MTRLYAILTTIILGISLAGCGKMATISNLESMAKAHGPCQIMDKHESEDENWIYVYDDTYGFTYEIKSSMVKTGIDGTMISSHPSIDDTYGKELRLTFFIKMGDEIDAYCQEHNCFYEITSPSEYNRVAFYSNNTDTYEEDEINF